MSGITSSESNEAVEMVMENQIVGPVKLVATYLIAIFFLAVPNVWAGARDGAGDFGHAETNLKMISFELAQQLRSRNQMSLDSFLSERPQLSNPMIELRDVNMDLIANLILETRPQFNENVEERFLYWDQDAKGVHLKALRNFYIVFGDMPLNNWDESRIMEVRARLLKEASHTWGYNDHQGLAFANRILSTIYRVAPGTLQIEDQLTLDRAKKVQIAHLKDEKEKLLKELYVARTQLAKVDAKLVAGERSLDANKKSIVVDNGTSRIVRNECLDWAIKSWLFLGIGGLICAVDHAATEQKIKNEMDAQFSVATQGLRTEKANLESQIVIILRRLDELTGQLGDLGA